MIVARRNTARLLLLGLSLLVACGGEEEAPEADPGRTAVPAPAARPAPPPAARLGTVEGTVRDGEGNPLSVGDALAAGAEVQVAEGASVSIDFADGASLRAPGPARLRFELLTGTARTVVLEAGAIARLEVRGIVTGVKTPLDAFVAVQAAAVSVALEESEEERRAVFTRLGDPAAEAATGGATSEAKVVDGATLIELAPGESHTATRPR